MNFIDELQLLKEQLRFDGKIKKTTGFSDIVIAGMGGSGVAGKIFQEFYSTVPVHTVDDYEIPDFVSKKTLFVAISFSGNTEETVDAVKKASKKKAYIVTISSGGMISDYADEKIKIPENKIQPRSAIGYMLTPLLRSFKLVDNDAIKATYKLLAELDRDNKECVLHAKRIVETMAIPVIYGHRPFKTVAYRWKTQFNENAKLIAYANNFPELNHNDTMALSHTYRKNSFYFITFESEDERMKRRVDATSEITNTELNLIKPKGRTAIEKLFYLIHYGDYVTYHTSTLRGVNPADIGLVEEIKRRLKTNKGK